MVPGRCPERHLTVGKANSADFNVDRQKKCNKNLTRSDEL